MRPPFLNPGDLDLELSGRVLGFAMFVSLLTGLLFGLVPALQLSRPQLVEHLKDRTNRASGYARLFALRNVLVMAQVALSLVTLVGSRPLPAQPPERAAHRSRLRHARTSCSSPSTPGRRGTPARRRKRSSAPSSSACGPCPT